MSEFVALIADVADSRQVEDFPRQRDRLLAKLSERHRGRGWSEYDYAVTAWDEFQGLLTTPRWLPGAVWELWRYFQPLSVRIGVGFGKVEFAPDATGRTPLNEAVTGQAFYHAREALDQLDAPVHGMSRVRIRVVAPDSVVAATCNAVLRLADALVQDITGRQWQVIEHYERAGKQAEVAAELGVSSSTVSRTLASARYRELRTSLSELGEVLAGGSGEHNKSADGAS